MQPSSERSFDWRYELQPRQLLGNLTAGFIIGLIAVAMSISLAVLVYSDDLQAFLVNGVGLILLGSALIGLTVALTSSLPGVSAIVQDTPTVIMAVVAASVVAALPGASDGVHFMTVVVTLALITLTTAGTFFVLGTLRFGRLVRYLPYPVVGGFLAGTGWLLFVGGIGIMSGMDISLSGFTGLFTADVGLRWLPGLGLAVLYFFITRRSDHFLTWPGLLLGTIALFYIVMWLSGGTPTEWRAQGLLLGPFPDTSLLQPLDYRELGQVQWGAVVSHLPNGVVVVFISLMSLLLNATGLELATGQKVDLDRELRAAGLANLLSGLAGGMVGFQALSFSTLNYRIGTGSRVATFVAIAMLFLTLFLGATFLAYIPTLFVGALLTFLGLSFLIEWLYDAYFKLPKPEYAVVWLILIVIAAFGFLQGVAVGALAAVVLFAVNYSRTEVVRHALTGASYRSRVSRDAEAQQLLEQQGDKLLILQLQGFLFFGTAHGLLERIETRLETASPTFVLLDLGRVTGLDATALLSFEKLTQLAATQNFTLVLAALPSSVVRPLEDSGVVRNERVRVFGSLDAGLEWCEAQLLGPPRPARSALHSQLGAITEVEVEELLTHFERLEIFPGDYLMRQGDPPTTLYFIESGQVTARLDSGGVRLETMRGGSVVGELGFYTGAPRGASVVADEASVVYRLDKLALARMTTENPRLAAAFHCLIARLTAGRAGHLMRVVEGLER